jgi:hypothetical protein
MSECRDRSAALTIHFVEGDERSLAAARAHLESCGACRDYGADLFGLQHSLEAWVDETPPAGLRERVMERALAAPRAVPRPAAAADALPLFGLVPVMVALVVAIRLVAGQLTALAYPPGSAGLTLVDLLGPTASAVLLLLALGGLATLALAPALFLETRGPRRTLGAHA